MQESQVFPRRGSILTINTFVVGLHMQESQVFPRRGSILTINTFVVGLHMQESQVFPRRGSILTMFIRILNLSKMRAITAYTSLCIRARAFAARTHKVYSWMRAQP